MINIGQGKIRGVVKEENEFFSNPFAGYSIQAEELIPGVGRVDLRRDKDYRLVIDVWYSNGKRTTVCLQESND